MESGLTTFNTMNTSHKSNSIIDYDSSEEDSLMSCISNQNLEESKNIFCPFCIKRNELISIEENRFHSPLTESKLLEYLYIKDKINPRSVDLMNHFFHPSKSKSKSKSFQFHFKPIQRQLNKTLLNTSEINQFIIKDLISRKGFYSNVFSAEILGNKLVAVKIYTSSICSSSNSKASSMSSSIQVEKSLLCREIFHREVFAIYNLPNIIDLIGIGLFSDGCPFVVMELGESELSPSFIKSDGLNDEPLLDLCHSLTTCLKMVHAKGFIHGDLKLSNIIIKNNTKNTTSKTTTTTNDTTTNTTTTSIRPSYILIDWNSAKHIYEGILEPKFVESLARKGTIKKPTRYTDLISLARVLIRIRLNEPKSSLSIQELRKVMSNRIESGTSFALVLKYLTDKALAKQKTAKTAKTKIENEKDDITDITSQTYLSQIYHQIDSVLN